MDSSFQFRLRDLREIYFLSFNPCFNGFFFSIEPDQHPTVQLEWSFNPCFNGFFFSIMAGGIIMPNTVASFNPCFNGFFFSIPWSRCQLKVCVVVSILVLMDSSFQFPGMRGLVGNNSSFNPCFNGFFFSIRNYICKFHLYGCFNPCFNGFFFSIANAHQHRLAAADRFNPCFNGFFFSIKWLMVDDTYKGLFQSLF